MKLNKKKKLAAKVLNIGKDRIIFDNTHLAEIKEAITKQDIRDLFRDGAIKIKGKKGRKKVVTRKRKSVGKIRKKINKRKRNYIILVRKLRKYVSELRKQNKIDRQEYYNLRKMIKNKNFRSKTSLQEYIKK